MNLDLEDRVVVLMALDILIAQMEEQRRESTYSSFAENALRAAKRTRDKIRAEDTP